MPLLASFPLQCPWEKKILRSGTEQAPTEKLFATHALEPKYLKTVALVVATKRVGICPTKSTIRKGWRACLLTTWTTC